MPWPFSLGPVALDFLFGILCFGFLACDLELLIYPSTKGPLAIDKSPTELSTKGPRSYRRKIHKVIYKRPTGWPWKKDPPAIEKKTLTVDKRPTEVSTKGPQSYRQIPKKLSTKGPRSYRQKAHWLLAIDKRPAGLSTKALKNNDKRPFGSWPAR